MTASTASIDTRSFQGASALITGGCGFIARHLTAALLDAGADVLLVDSNEPEQPLDPRARFVQATVGGERFRHLLRESRQPDYIFHLAGQAYAAGSVQTPLLDFTANLAATLDLLETLRQRGATSKLLFASSAAVYGNPERLPITERDVTVPISPYGVSKLAAERYVAVYAQLYGLPAASLRLFSVYGPGQRKQVVYDLFTKLQRSPNELIVIGDGTQVRDMVYVDDVARAFLAVAACGRSDGAVYNVASGVGTSTADLARGIIAAQGGGARIAFTEQSRPGDPERWLGSAAPLDALGAAPRITLQHGLRATAAWFNTTVGQSKERTV